MDTSTYFAAASQRDANYSQATILMDRLLLESQPFVTTNFVLAELHGLVLNRVSHHYARKVVELIQRSSTTTIVRAQRRDEERAWEILTSYDDKAFSYTDALSFAVMERLEIFTAFCFDRHFQQFGWRVVS